MVEKRVKTICPDLLFSLMVFSCLCCAIHVPYLAIPEFAHTGHRNSVYTEKLPKDQCKIFNYNTTCIFRRMAVQRYELGADAFSRPVDHVLDVVGADFRSHPEKIPAKPENVKKTLARKLTFLRAILDKLSVGLNVL